MVNCHNPPVLCVLKHARAQRGERRGNVALHKIPIDEDEKRHGGAGDRGVGILDLTASRISG